MIASNRHVALKPLPWEPERAEAAIADIVGDALSHFDEQNFWPAHPQDDFAADGDTSAYLGATGMIWGLDYLARVGATNAVFDFRPVLRHLLEANRVAFSKMDYAAHGSLLFGDLGAGLLAMRLAPDSDTANLVHARSAANTDLPIRELMWGMPGSMLACLQMFEMTQEPRWQELYKIQAARLLDELEDTGRGPLWRQDLYGSHEQWLGPVHGYAGNTIPLMKGWHWLSSSQRARIAEAIPKTLSANAWRCEFGATWHARVVDGRSPELCQYCHGAPGMVTVFADAPFTSPDLEALLIEGGEFTWKAGPLAKGSNLCHGTGGNGYAFLKLHRRTEDPVWLDRARAFAMMAISQCEEARQEYGRGRYSLWTGDIGLAVYLRDCLKIDAQFPMIDA